MREEGGGVIVLSSGSNGTLSSSILIRKFVLVISTVRRYTDSSSIQMGSGAVVENALILLLSLREESLRAPSWCPGLVVLGRSPARSTLRGSRAFKERPVAGLLAASLCLQS